jgi:hypothetical protein
MVDHRPNPFVYGRVLAREDAACARPEYERAILTTVRDKGRLALVGDRRLGKSTLIERTLASRAEPTLRVDFHGVLSFDDLVHRFAESLEELLRQRSFVAKHVVPWLREVGLGLESIKLGFKGAEVALSTRVPTDQLVRLLGYVAAIAKRQSFCLFIDEFQEIQDRLPPKEGEAALGILRSEIQRLRIPCFFAGSARLSFISLFTAERSPFFESARLLEIKPIPEGQFQSYLIAQFRRCSLTLSAEQAKSLLAIGADSPNDVQHLAHEAFNACTGKVIEGAQIGAALAKILGDITPFAEHHVDSLTLRQQRVLFIVALFEQLGAGTREFHTLAGANAQSAIVKAVAPGLLGLDPLLEKVGSRYRVRSRYLRLWLATRKRQVQALIPQLRDDERYAAALMQVCPRLPAELRIPV